MKICFLTRRREGSGSTRVRVLQYIKHLHELGIETIILPRPVQGGPLSHGKYLAQAVRAASDSDVTFLQKPNQSKRLIDLLMRFNRRLIVDLDDAVWSPPLTRTNEATNRLSLKFRDRLIYAVQKAQMVIAGSQHLANMIRGFAPDADITVIPSSVDLERYPLKKTLEKKNEVVIGWIGNPGNYSNLIQILPTLRSICNHGNVKFRVISSKPPDFEELPLEFEPWSVETEVRSLSGLDIGIMPLDDDERSLGRCGYKAIQYMAVGIPVIASSRGSGAEVIEHNVTGFHAKDPEEWRTALQLLIGDSDRRSEMGAKGRNRVECLYSIQKNVHQLVDLFQMRMKMGET